MFLFLWACSGQKTVDTADDNQHDTAQSTSETSPCFSDEVIEPFVVFAQPYDEDGNQVNQWILKSQDQSEHSFEMGRATTGEVQLSPDGSWGVVAQDDGSIGLFRFLDGTVQVLHNQQTLQSNQGAIYVGGLDIDFLSGTVWITDPNWPNNGGGLFQATIDCQSGEIGQATMVFASKNAITSQSIRDERVFVSRPVDSLEQQISIFNPNTFEILGGINGFNDDEAIFSAIAVGTDTLLLGDNNSFSEIPNRVAHIQWDSSNHSGVVANTINVEDPIDIHIVDDWALIASGFGNSLWQYQLSTQTLSELSLEQNSQLPSNIVSADGFTEYLYVSETSAIRKLQSTATGYQDLGLVITTEGISGLVGAIGVHGNYYSN